MTNELGLSLHETSILYGTGTHRNGPYDTRTDEEREAAHQRCVEWISAWRSLTDAQQALVHALPRSERHNAFYETTAAELIDLVGQLERDSA